MISTETICSPEKSILLNYTEGTGYMLVAPVYSAAFSACMPDKTVPPIQEWVV